MPPVSERHLLVTLLAAVGLAESSFTPASVRGLHAAVYMLPSGAPAGSNYWDNRKGSTLWANDTLWSVFQQSQDRDVAMLSSLLGGVKRGSATVIVGVHLYLADPIWKDSSPLARLAEALAHFRSSQLRTILFVLDMEFYSIGTWSHTHDIVRNTTARKYALNMLHELLIAPGIAENTDFVSTYWVGESGRCNGKVGVCTEKQISNLITDLQAVANNKGLTYLQHVDGQFWSGPANYSGYSATSLRDAQGVMAESWCQGNLVPGVTALLSRGGATRSTLLLLNDVPNCDLRDSDRRCSASGPTNVTADTLQWFTWLDELGLAGTWGIWDFIDGGCSPNVGCDPNAYGDVMLSLSRPGAEFTTKGVLHREQALKDL